MKYKKTKVVNYRQQNDNLNILETCTFLDCDQYRTNYDGHIDITRQKHTLGIQYKHESKEEREQRIPNFLNCDNYGSLHASNPDPFLDDTPTNDNELHQVICNTFKIDYFQEMDIIIKF